MFHYARGMSYAAKLDFAAAQTELSALEAIAGDPQTRPLDQPQLPGAKMIVLSKNILAGELAGRRLQNTEMNQYFATAIQLEDALPYMEPPYWHHPVRRIYGAALLHSGHPIPAEKIYREDLQSHPANGWSLYGLLSSLRAQGKTEEAKATGKLFRDTWRLADITLTASSF
jgi:hypothetical protein